MHGFLLALKLLALVRGKEEGVGREMVRVQVGHMR